MDQEPTGLQFELEEDEFSEPQKAQIRDMYEAIKLVHRKAIAEDYDGFDGHDVIEINRTVLEKAFLLNPHLYGRLRKGNVEIFSKIGGKKRKSSVVPTDAKELPYIFDNFSKTLKEKTSTISPDSTLAEVLDIAAWSHIEIIRIHPFLEGNGRTARLLVDLIFARANLPYITDWGSKNREYIETVYETHKQLKPQIFKSFLAKKLSKSLQDLEKVGPGVAEYVKDTRQQVDEYITNLKVQNES